MKRVNEMLSIIKVVENNTEDDPSIFIVYYSNF